VTDILGIQTKGTEVNELVGTKMAKKIRDEYYGILGVKRK
jgi:hypothetical protein